MKKHLFSLCVVLLAVCGIATANNTWFEESRNFSAYALGQGKVHVKVLVFARGGTNNHWATTKNGGSVVYAYAPNGDSIPALQYEGDNSKNCENDYKGWVNFLVRQGTVIITNPNEGDKGCTYTSSNGWKSLYLTRMGEKYTPTYIEFDWYPPASLDNKTYTLKARITDTRKYGDTWTRTWNLGEFSGSDLQAPMLYQPVFYSVGEDGQPGLGNVVVPYMVYQEPQSYTTSATGNTTYECKERAGQMLVMTTDTVQYAFYANFTVVREDKTTTVVSSSKIDIPAFHRIHDFTAEHYLNGNGKKEGAKTTLTWTVKTPWATDILPTDMFQIQRAYHPDFSDAETMALIPYEQGKGTYEWEDDTEGAMINQRTDTTDLNIYYRVNRVSTINWGYEGHEWVAATHINKNNQLPVFDSLKSSCRKADDFKESKRVLFSLQTEKDPGNTQSFYWDERATIHLRRLAISAVDTVITERVFPGSMMRTLPDSTYSITFEDIADISCCDYEYEVYIDDSQSQLKILPDSQSRNIPPFKDLDLYYTDAASIATFRVSDGLYPNRIFLQWNQTTGGVDSFYVYRSTLSTTRGEEIARLAGQNYYIDTNVVPGTVYYYTVVASYLCGGVRQTQSTSPTKGSLSPYGYIRGRITYPNGTGNAGVTVRAEPSPSPADEAIHHLYADPEEAVYNQTEAPISLSGDFSIQMMVKDVDLTVVNGDGHPLLWSTDSTLLIELSDESDLQPGESTSDKAYAIRFTMGNETRLLGLNNENNTSDGNNIFSLTLTYCAHSQTVSLYRDARQTATSTIPLHILHSPLRFNCPYSRTPISSYGVGIDEVRIFHRVLSEDDIRTYSRHALAGDEQGLILYYKFDMAPLYNIHLPNMAKTQSTDGDGLLAANNRLIWDEAQHDSSYPYIHLAGDLITRFEALTDEGGNYTLAGIPFANGITYSVTPTAQHGTFRYNGTSSASATITIGNTRPEASGVDFVNTDAVRFSGRILYERSTIPVKGVHFLVNGVLATDATGNPVETNESGNFQFELPKAPIRVQAVKDGHRFTDNGYLILNGDTLFQPTDNIDGVRFYDQTKVRLIGRVAGGNDQGLLPLGFGLSRNNLGDSICMVLELEGDNAAQIVFDPLDKTLNRIDTTIVHAIDTTQHTGISLQSKRIMIYPDQTSGEFFADLFPVKYKVTLLTAQGYSTLTNEKTTMQVIDLTNKLDSQCNILTEYAGVPARYTGKQQDTLRITFHDTFRHIYHSQVSITPVQSLYGMELGYFGVERIDVQRWDGTEEKQSVALAQEDDTYEYLFGKPIFTEGKYTFNIYAHEDYYYNGNRTLGKHDRVMLHEGEVKVYNGMHSNTEVLTGTLDKDGVCRNMVLRADYPTYTRVDEDAARSIQITVTYERESYTTEPLQVLVFADRRDGTEAISSTTADITLYDILRDPPGSGSFSTLSAGASYSASKTWNLSVKAGVTIEFSKGVTYSGFVGAITYIPGLISGQDYKINTTTPFTIPLVYNLSFNKDYSYSYSTTETIRTGSDAYHVGAMADLYLGAVENLYLSTCHGMAVVDSLTYVSMAAQEKDGTVHPIATARNPQGELRHLVVAPKIALEMVQEATFCYTQEHILTTVIPKLVVQRNALVLCVDSTAAQAKANQEQRRIYYSTLSPDSDDFAVTYGKGYHYVDPINSHRVEADSVAGINRAILGWTNLIKRNETEKVNAQYANDKHTYSVAGGSTLTYSETVDYGSKYTFMPYDLGGTVGASDLSNLWGGTINRTIRTLLKVGGKADSIVIQNETPGSKFSFSLKPVANVDYKPTYITSEHKSRTYGYTLSPDSYGYMDVQVMRVRDTISDFFQNSTDTLAETGKNTSSTLQTYSSFIFYQLAGASRCPWEDADSTLFYLPGTPLSNATARLENPQITIAQREISNVPADQKAIFQIALSNEQTYDTGYGATDLPLELSLSPGSNPNGLKVTMDGQPLTSTAIPLRIPHGTTLHKTIEVERGQGYDFENVTLKLRSTCDIMEYALASFSVHFVPAATAVSMPTPHDQWVLNTQSARDSAGYYLPVSIDGFDIHSDGFDHIELQYKPHTASDNDWVNICSYYVSDSLYQLASGTKQRITGSKIDNIRFYGGRDPMEQEYDLRAMAFARYGNGFVTRASEVLHGVKDTRRPELFGTPTPADGILSVGDVLSLRFSEPIAGNLLDEDANFEVIGTADQLSLATSLHFTGEPSCYATTKVTRNMNARPFTIEAMIKPESGQGSLQTIFALGNEKEPLWFAWAGDHLEAQIGDVRLQSAGVEPILDFTRVALTYDPEDSTAHFYAGTQEIDIKTPSGSPYDGGEPSKPSYHSSGQLIWGNNATHTAPFQGNMVEARLWTKALTQAELALYKDRHLTGYERELVAYYPMNEGQGTTCTDQANGATLALNGTSWVLPEGMSVHLNGSEPVRLNGDLLSRSAIEDLTLFLSFKADENDTDTAALLRAGKHSFLITSEAMIWQTDSNRLTANGFFRNGQWHQLAVSIDRAANVASLVIDGNTLLATTADDMPAFADSIWTLGQSFRGHIDAFSLYEQPLPSYVIERYNNFAPQGDEMGLIAYMPFGQYVLQPNGRYELVYSPENARIFRDADGNTVEKHQRLVVNDLSHYTDKHDYAPLRTAAARQKLNFSWATNGDELMININMPDHEINHRHLLLTVQRVEDQHGNAMLCPRTWTAYVNRQQLRWDNPQQEYTINNETDALPYTFTATIRNGGGTTRQYELNSLPSWITAQPATGVLAPLETQTITFTVDEGLNIGDYTEYVYLTDDRQLDDRLLLNLHVKATCPWTLDQSELNRSMSLVGQVYIPAENGSFRIDTDSQDMVAAFVGEQCVALAPVRLNQQTQPVTYMTIYGNDSHAGKELRFQLWHAANGKVYILAPSEDITFHANDCYGCEGTPVTLTVTDRQIQLLDLQAGWNWFSLYLKPTYRNNLTRLFGSSNAWTNGDIIKDPTEQYFAEYRVNNTPIRWFGTLSMIRYQNIFLAHTANPVQLQIEGDPLDDEGRTLTLSQGWNVLPYLLPDKQSLTDALADYYDQASEGDLIKSRDAFAVFSNASKWEGNLTYMQPGQGYMLRRLAQDPCSFTYYTYGQVDKGISEQGAKSKEQRPNGSATTMSVIATVETGQGLALYPSSENFTLAAYIGNTLVGICYPQQAGTNAQDSLCFLSIADGAEGSGQAASGRIRFVLLRDGEPVACGTQTLPYEQDAVVGTLRKPYRITLQSCEDGQDKPYKILENQQIYIIRNENKYNILGIH
ncbi:MAG: LamG-like jellyroll fold domain-containing protein [Paludibacteraceae bacterium]